MSETTPNIQYLPIPGLAGYRAGTDGTIWSCRKRGGPKQWYFSDEWTILKPKLEHTGYYRVSLMTDVKNKRLTASVHGLIMLTFVGPCPEGMQCRHLNGVCTDNQLANLAWGTIQENHDDKQKHGTTARGETNGLSRLTEEQVREIRLLATQGISYKVIAKRFDISDTNITNIVRRDTWQHTDLDIPPISIGHVVGSKHKNSKITSDIVREIRRMHSEGRTQDYIASVFGICQQTVWSVVRNKTWKHVV